MAGFYDDAEGGIGENSDSLTSKYNSAALINLTIAELWKDSYRHSRAGEFSKWNADLNCIWVELGGDLKEDNEKDNDYIKQFDKVEDELAALGSLTKKKTGFNVTTQKETLTYAAQYKVLMKKALFLKRLQNKQGKGTAYEDDMDSYMDL